MSKTCSKCLIERDLCEFYRRSDKFRAECKSCFNRRTKEYNATHPDVIKKIRARGAPRQRKWIQEYFDKLRECGPTIIRKEKLCPRCSLVKQISDFRKKRIAPDGHQPICKNCDATDDLRRTIGQSIRTCSPNGKRKKLEKYGIDVTAITEAIGPKPGINYHLDHIIPLCAFDYADEIQIKASWHPKNLQWILAKENLIKGGKYIQSEFDEYLSWYLQMQSYQP